MPAIRRATPEDLDDVLAINRESSSAHDHARIAYLRDALARGACLLAHYRCTTAGFAIWDTRFYEYPFVWLLEVRPAHRRRGVACALMRHVEEACGADRVFTSTNESNAPMRALCAKLGYALSGRIDNLDEGDPELVYCRRVPRAD